MRFLNEIGWAIVLPALVGVFSTLIATIVSLRAQYKINRIQQLSEMHQNEQIEDIPNKGLINQAIKEWVRKNRSTLDRLKVLWKYKLMIIAVTTIAAVFVLVYVIIAQTKPPEKSPLPKFYEAKALVLLGEPESEGVLSQLLSESGLGFISRIAGSPDGGYGGLAMKLLDSDTLLSDIVDKFELVNRYKVVNSISGNTLKIIRKKSEFDYDLNTGTLSISFRDYDPEFAAQMANYSVDLLDKLITRIRENRIQNEKTHLEEKLAETDLELSRIEKELLEFHQKHRDRLFFDSFDIQDSAVRASSADSSSAELALHYSNIMRAYNTQNEIYNTLYKQFELLKLSTEQYPNYFQVFERAGVPDLKAGPSYSAIWVITTFLAFIFSIVLAFVLDTISSYRGDLLSSRREEDFPHYSPRSPI